MAAAYELSEFAKEAKEETYPLTNGGAGVSSLTALSMKRYPSSIVASSIIFCFTSDNLQGYALAVAI